MSRNRVRLMALSDRRQVEQIERDTGGEWDTHSFDFLRHDSNVLAVVYEEDGYVTGFAYYVSLVDSVEVLNLAGERSALRHLTQWIADKCRAKVRDGILIPERRLDWAEFGVIRD